jgi:hypothetical protein
MASSARMAKDIDCGNHIPGRSGSHSSLDPLVAFIAAGSKSNLRM